MALRYGRFDYAPEQVIKLLDTVKKTVLGRVEQGKLTPKGNAEGERYLDYLLSEYSEHLIPKKDGPSAG